jgi:hypothetical protein
MATKVRIVGTAIRLFVGDGCRLDEPHCQGSGDLPGGSWPAFGWGGLNVVSLEYFLDESTKKGCRERLWERVCGHATRAGYGQASRMRRVEAYVSAQMTFGGQLFRKLQ